MASRVDEMDKHIGQKLKMARIVRGMSQDELGQTVNITFQQIQKYEKGLNRISANRLKQFADLLKVSIDYFFRKEDMFGSNEALAESAIKIFEYTNQNNKEQNSNQEIEENNNQIHQHNFQDPLSNIQNKSKRREKIQKFLKKTSKNTLEDFEPNNSNEEEKELLDSYRSIQSSAVKKHILSLIKSMKDNT